MPDQETPINGTASYNLDLPIPSVTWQGRSAGESYIMAAERPGPGESEALVNAFNETFRVTTVIADVANQKAGDLQRGAFQQHMLENTTTFFRPMADYYRKAIFAQERENDQFEADMTAPTTKQLENTNALVRDMPFASEARAMLTATTKKADQIAMIGKASRSTLAAWHEAADFFIHVDDETKGFIKDRLMRLTLIQRSGMQAEYALKPTLENPVVRGPDLEAAERAAEQALDGWKARREGLKNHRMMVRQMAMLMAAVSGIPAKRALEILTETE